MPRRSRRQALYAALRPKPCSVAMRHEWRFSAFLPRLDFVEFGQRPFEFFVEQPHRIENFAEGRRWSWPVNLAKAEDSVIAQISHERRIGDLIVGCVA